MFEEKKKKLQDQTLVPPMKLRLEN